MDRPRKGRSKLRARRPAQPDPKPKRSRDRNRTAPRRAPEPAATRYVGVLVQGASGPVLLPSGDRRAPPAVRVAAPSAGKSESGVLAVAVLESGGSANGAPLGRIVEVLGPAGDLDAEARAVARLHDLQDRFSETALAEAEETAARFLEAERPGAFGAREPLGDLVAVTIDPEDARDFDDAVSISKGPDGAVVLGVHIADVAAFVPEGGALDREAQARGTSVYLPRRVLPMLPEVLSNGVCSLTAGEPRLTRSAFITYDAAGNRLSARLADTLLVSRARLTYEEALRIAKRADGELQEPIAASLRWMLRLAERIERRRLRAGMLDLDLPEAELRFDESERVIGAAPRRSTPMHRMIEMFMVEANEVVAETLASTGAPFIRRVHAEPDEDALASLEALVRSLGLTLARRPTRRDLQALLDQVRSTDMGRALGFALLRSLPRAVYSAAALGHFALASEHYCHFTSPIRRYPDLTVHRLVARLLRGAPPAEDPEAALLLDDLAERLSAAERRAAAAEQELATVLILRHLSERIGLVFDSFVSGMGEMGVFVQHPDFLVDGLVRFTDLGGEWWDVSTAYGIARGSTTGTTLHLGDRLRVRIARVDILRRHLDLDIPKA